jgi:carbohydrate-selective porin OprB
MSLSKLTGLQAYSNMKRLMVNHKSGVQGYCHRTCQNAWGLPVKYSSAIDAWNHIPAKHRHTDLSKAPIGAPIFFDGGHYGHVVLQSDKKGIVIGTDAPANNYVGEVAVTWFAKHWGKKVLGWASMYNDVELQLKEMPK